MRKMAFTDSYYLRCREIRSTERLGDAYSFPCDEQGNVPNSPQAHWWKNYQSITRGEKRTTPLRVVTVRVVAP